MDQARVRSMCVVSNNNETSPSQCCFVPEVEGRSADRPPNCCGSGEVGEVNMGQQCSREREHTTSYRSSYVVLTLPVSDETSVISDFTLHVAHSISSYM